MNGLDLTEWFARMSEVDALGTTKSWLSGVSCVFGVLVLFCCVFMLNRDFNEQKIPGMAIAFTGVFLTVAAILLTASVYVNHQQHAIDTSVESLVEYVADGYGVDDLSCYLTEDDMKGMDDTAICTFPNPDTDMTRKSDIFKYADITIRDNRAYLYDEDRNLMEVRK